MISRSCTRAAIWASRSPADLDHPFDERAHQPFSDPANVAGHSTSRRADAAGARAQLPSPFFRLAVSAIAGRRLLLSELDTATGEALSRLPAGRTGAGSLDRAIDATERNRTLIEIDPTTGAALLRVLEPRTARTAEQRHARRSSDLTAYDGALADPTSLASLAASLTTGTLLSPTRLQAYATCPFSFFAERVLGVRVIDEPDEVLRIEPSIRGSLVHEVLEGFLGEQEPGRLDPSQRAALHVRLAAIADETLARADSEGATGAPLLWRHDRDTILADLRTWLDREIDDDTPFGRHDLEISFGDGPEPFVLTVGSRELRFRGRIDRLDSSPSGAFRVTDYKTGRNKATKATGLDGGRALQLPVYLLAAAHLLGFDAADGRAGYYFVTRAEGFQRVELSDAELAGRRDDLDTVLGRIADGIAAGDFHAEPGDPCRYCDFDAACPVTRKSLRERKAGDPRIVGFEEMRQVP